MNIVFDPLKSPETLTPDYVFFYDKKKNMIIDGVFSKLMFSNEYVSCSCLLLNTPFQFSLSNVTNKHHWISINTDGKPYDEPISKWNVQLLPCEPNKVLIDVLSKYEEQILMQYKQMSGIKHSCALSLRGQLNSGFISVTNDNVISGTRRNGYTDFINDSTYTIRSRNHQVFVPDRGLFKSQQTDDGIGRKFPSDTNIVLKISGVWETSTHVGITYKFIIG